MSTRFCPTETKGRVHFYCRKKKEAAERMDTMFTFKCELMEKGCPAMKWDSAVTVTRRNGKMVEAIVDGMNDIFRIIMGVYSDGYFLAIPSEDIGIDVKDLEDVPVLFCRLADFLEPEDALSVAQAVSIVAVLEEFTDESLCFD